MFEKFGVDTFINTSIQNNTMFQRRPNKFRKVRPIHAYKGNISYGLSVPYECAQQFKDIYFTITYDKDKIIFMSGCKTSYN